MLDIPTAAALVRRAAAAADVVVVNMHIGAEGADRAHVRRGPETFLGEQRGDPIRFAHAVVDAGADLVVGHGPHVLRGMEFYRGFSGSNDGVAHFAHLGGMLVGFFLIRYWKKKVLL